MVAVLRTSSARERTLIPSGPSSSDWERVAIVVRPTRCLRSTVDDCAVPKNFGLVGETAVPVPVPAPDGVATGTIATQNGAAEPQTRKVPCPAVPC